MSKINPDNITRAEFNKKYYRKYFSTKRRLIEWKFKPHFFEKKKDVFVEQDLFARLLGQYSEVVETDKGFTFLPCNSVGHIHDLKPLIGLKLIKIHSKPQLIVKG